MLSHSFLNMLGLCSRAGKCLFGETACLSGIRSGKVRLLLIDSGASENTAKRFSNACAHYNIPMLAFDEQCDAAMAAGKPGRKMIAVSDQSFAQSLLRLTQPNI